MHAGSIEISEKSIRNMNESHHCCDLACKLEEHIHVKQDGSPKYNEGLIIGKFYPPHRGHQYLIESAKSQVRVLHVVVCDKKGEIPPACLREMWLREMYPDVSVYRLDDIYDPLDSKIWAKIAVDLLGHHPDVVFTSEDYGTAWASYLGCPHIMVDKERLRYSVSGTQVRKDPLKMWDFLAPCVRGYYAKRIVIIGPESCGKTTLCKRLANFFDTIWVPEYGREFCEKKETLASPWNTDDFVAIAKEQKKREDEGARRCNKILFCDTDSLATAIFHEFYLGSESQEVKQLVLDHGSPHLYLVSSYIDAEYVQDGTRMDSHVRPLMYNRFIGELQQFNRPFRILTGSWDDRFEQAKSYASELLASK